LGARDGEIITGIRDLFLPAYAKQLGAEYRLDLKVVEI
jgi:hypothetical protein